MRDLDRELQLAGIDSGRANDEELDQTHALLMPVRPQLFSGYWWARVPGEDFIGWERIEPSYHSLAETCSCLWDLIDLGDNFRSDRIMSFVSKWGLINLGEDPDPRDKYAAGVSDVDEWKYAARTASNLLQLIYDTESELLIPDSAIEGFVLNERYTCLKEFSIDTYQRWDVRIEADPDAPMQESIAADRGVTEAIEYWRSARRTGQGLELQRRLVSAMLLAWMPSPVLNPVWDDRGRRNEAMALGVYEIVGSHLYSIFGSPQIGVYPCSICDRLFEFEAGEGRHRPGRGRRRYCSDDCRAKGKREDNLTSWHRNKSRWTRPRQAEEGSE